MRFLIVFAAALACATAAPSHLLPYAAYSAIPAIPFAAVPTVSSGDIQGAAIDAHVKAADFAQATIDKARLLSEQAAENLNTEVITTVDQGKERLADAYWATEDKKWQALDAWKTTEAQIDGAIASKADFLAKSAVGAPYVAAVGAFGPVVYSGYAAPALNSFSAQTIVHSYPEAAKADGESLKVEAAAKAAELAKEAESAKEKSAEAVSAAASAAAELKSEADKALGAFKASVFSPVAVSGAFPYTAGYPYSGVAISPDFAHAVALNNPGLKYVSNVQHIEPTSATFFKTKW